jgi:NAD(P)-dependent dehydrogenase (short-subunit alcohol dehydrogenase family)
MVQWTKSMEVNVSSMVMMSKYAIPEMKKNEGQWRGSIVNMASVAGIRGGNPHLLYPTSKGAVVVRSPECSSAAKTKLTRHPEYDPCDGLTSRS